LEVKLAGILSLKPEDEKIIHREALKWFNARMTCPHKVYHLLS